jgi:hypothetical protein
VRDHYGKWASAICHSAKGLRQHAIMKRDTTVEMPSERLWSVLFPFYPCLILFLFLSSLRRPTERGKETDRTLLAAALPTRAARCSLPPAARPPASERSPPPSRAPPGERPTMSASRPSAPHDERLPMECSWSNLIQ